MRNTAQLFLAVVLFLLTVQTHGNIADDFKQLCDLIPGFYDNVDQYNEDIRKGLPPKERHQRLQTSLVEETVNFLPGTVNFYIEQYVNNSKSDVIRQRLYSVGIDPEGRLVLKIYSFKNPAQVLHAKAFDPVFKSLTQNDVIYAEGCDVFWSKVDTSPLRFQTWNEKTCYITFNGLRVLVDTSQNLTETYLTSGEKWLLSNGTDILGEPSPYNMTRQKTTPNEPHGISTVHTERTSNDSERPLAKFVDVTENLFGGRPVRFHATLTICNKLSATDTAPDMPVQLGGPVEAYEYFNDSRFGPEEFFGFSYSSRTNTEKGAMAQLTEVLVFAKGSVFVNLTVLSADLRTQVSKTTYSCSMAPLNGIPPSATFFVDDRATLTSLQTYEAFKSALWDGYRVRSTSFYENCTGVGANAIGGSSVEDFQIFEDRIESATTKMITNYQGAGYVYDVVSATYWANGSVIFVASDVDVVTLKPYYVETIACRFGGGSMSFYKLW